MSKEITILDCDGPCALFDITCLKAVNPLLTEQDIRNLHDWDIFKIFNEEELNICKNILKDPQFWASLPPNEHAQIAVEKIRQNDAEVIFCTSPWEDCREWEAVRRDWLKKHFNAKGRQDIIITEAKHLIYGDVFIDDKLNTVQAWHEKWSIHGKKSLLFETNSNFNCGWYPRIVVSNNNWKILENEQK